MSDETDPYYAENGTVWRRPVLTEKDGGTHISIGFMVCVMSEDVEKDTAEKVAKLMNAGHRALNN